MTTAVPAVSIFSYACQCVWNVQYLLFSCQTGGLSHPAFIDASGNLFKSSLLLHSKSIRWGGGSIIVSVGGYLGEWHVHSWKNDPTSNSSMNQRGITNTTHSKAIKQVQEGVLTLCVWVCVLQEVKVARKTEITFTQIRSFTPESCPVQPTVWPAGAPLWCRRGNKSCFFNPHLILLLHAYASLFFLL